MSRLPSAISRAKDLSPTAVRILVVTVSVALVAALGGLVEGVDRDLYDQALRWRADGRSAVPGPYVLVEIDDRSIDALGRFPWDRSLFARLVDRTRAADARVVGVDVVFAEPADPAGDDALAAALARAGNVVLAAAPVLGPAEQGRLPVARTVVDPIPSLHAAAAGVGSISILEDVDGAMRRYSFLVRGPGGEPYPSFAQLVASFALGDAEGSVALAPDGSFLINYGSLSPASVVRVSFADAMGYGDVEARELFGDRVVLVGATYTGGTDYGPTPLAARSPRVFAQLYAIHTLVSGRHLREVHAAVPFVLALLAVALLAIQIPARHPLQLLGMGTALVAVLLAGAFALYLLEGIVLGPGLPVLATGLVVSGYGLEEWWATNVNLRKRNVELQETLENLRQTRSAKERMEAELAIAREIQFSMLPQDSPAFPDRTDFAVHAMLVPALEVGGDFYDYFLVDDDHLCVCIADVSGKGVPAALFMAVAKAVIKSIVAREHSPAVILSTANRELARDNEASMFVSVWLGILDLRSGFLAYTNAGHNPPWVLRRGQPPEPLDARHGPVLAALDEVEYEEGRVHLGPEDAFVLYTDGVPEARDPGGELYGHDRLRSLMAAAAGQRARHVVEAAAGDVWRFQDEALQADDLTLVAVQYLGDGGPRTEEGVRGASPGASEPTGGGERAPALHVEVENRVEEISRAKEAFDHFVAGHGVPAAVRRSMMLGLDDVLGNVVSHAFDDDGRHVIGVDVEVDADRVTVRVTDDGRPFDPTDHPVPDLGLGIEHRPLGGLGLHLVRSLMDEIRHTREDGRNVTVLVKNIPERSSAEDREGRGANVDITTVEKDGITRVRLAGSLDTGTARTAQRELDSLIEGGARRILVDLEELDYVSSAGLRVFLGTAKKLRRTGGGLRFCRLNESVAEVFGLAGFDRIFELFDSPEDALRGF